MSRAQLSVMVHLLELSSSWVRPHLSLISFAIVATVLVIYGGEINRFVRDATKPYHLVVRVTAFVLLSAFGYGWATGKLSALLTKVLATQVGSWTGMLVLAIFIGLGFLAERKNHV